MSIIDTLVTDRTQADADARNDKGTYNAADLNRVTEAMEYLKAQMNRYGYEVSGYAPVRDGLWEDADIPTVSQMEQYISNVEAIRATLAVLPATPNTPTDMELLTWMDANDIEQILSDVWLVILQVVYSFARCGAFTFWSDNRPLPSAESYLGRTWAEQDALQTTWRQWQAADWYLLVYGNLIAEEDVA